jgi:hypothetical protein
VRSALCFALGSFLIASAAGARVTCIEILRKEAFADSNMFGMVGAYEKIVGPFHGELDPSQPPNAMIVDFAEAPRNARSNVEYSADFYILKPTDLAKGNGALLYDANNRGNKRALIAFDSAPPSNDPTTPEQAGNAEWIPGLPDVQNNLRIEVPTASMAGWSVRGATTGGAGELCYLDGSCLAFAKTKIEQKATGTVACPWTSVTTALLSTLRKCEKRRWTCRGTGICCQMSNASLRAAAVGW